MMKQRKRLMANRLSELKKTSSWATVGPAKQHASGTNQRIKALRHGRHWVWCLTHRREIKEETIAISRDWVYNKVSMLNAPIL